MRKVCSYFLSIFLLYLGYSILKINKVKALECLPTCSSVDGRFLTITGPD